MKKIFSVVAIMAVAATMFTSCKGDEADSVKAKLSLNGEPLSVAVAAEGTFTVTSDIDAPEAIVISVESSDNKILTVDPASVTIAKGAKSITGKYKGVADGKAKITIKTTNATISKGSIDITVGNPPAPAAEIAKMVTGNAEGKDGFKYIYAYHEDPEDTSKPEGQRINLAYFDIFADTDKNIVMNFYSADSGEMPKGMGKLQQQGNAGEDGISLIAVKEGDSINIDAMIESPWGYFQRIYSSEHKDFTTGQDSYIAFAIGNGYSTSATLRGWAKINLGADGSWDSMKLIEAYVCLNDGEFKVGQKN